MLKVKKSTRILLAFVLTMAMVFSLATTVSAAGVETWYSRDGRVYEDKFTIQGYNITPVKTMGSAGTLDIVVDFVLPPGNTKSTTLTVELRNTNGTVLERAVVYNETSFYTLAVSTTVYIGQKIQLYVGAYSGGSYMTCDIYYSHQIL